MRLSYVEIRDYRSIFVDDAGHALRLELAPGANTLVGQNNCGKSNVLRAISLALDPHHAFDPEVDTPGPRPFSHPIITLGFAGDPANPDDAPVLAAADSYERSLAVAMERRKSFRGEVALQVSFVPTPDGVRREETLLTDPSALPVSGGEPPGGPLETALAALREAVRFVLISSGESIESVLEGNFREILHSVVRERLRSEFDTAERSRQEYVKGLQDSLLGPLRDRLVRDVGGMFPEIDGISLSPEVSTIERTLSNVGVHLEDIVATPLAGKGTGVRGGVLVAMLSYLALNATRSMVFAVEEPEAFLHPASQEDLRDHLEQLAAAQGVTLIVTTHSPYTVTRSPKGRVFCLAKDREGRTRIGEVASGDAEHAPLIGGLLREASIESMITAASALPPGTEAVVLVEGEGDRFCFELAARVVGRPALLAGLAFQPTGGTVKMVAQAVIMRAAIGDLPLAIVVDDDQNGREIRKMLVGNLFKFNSKRVISYAEVFPPGDEWRKVHVEAEDLFAPALIARFAQTHGDAVVDGTRKRPDNSYHYDFGQAAKEALSAWLAEEARPVDVERWIEMLMLVRHRAGLPKPVESAAELIASAPAHVTAASGPQLDGAALIVTGPHDHARYLATTALILGGEQRIADGVTHVGFYAKGIQAHVPAVVADHPNLLFAPSTIEMLKATGKPADARVAEIIAEVLRSSPELEGEARRVLLLSPPDDEATLVLEQPVRNTKTISGRPVAWTLSPRVVPLSVLAASPATTDELDHAVHALEGP